ncbi:MAG TPA: endopygalactorunase [Niastella sp.]
MIAFKKTLLLIIISSACMLKPAFANNPSPFTTGIKPVAFATHIAAITNNTIVVVTGSTMRFTVDTPEDQGLCSTRTTVKQLLEQIISTDGAVQQYKLIDKTGNTKTEGTIEPNDKLIVTSQNGKAAQTYQLTIKPMALSGRLQLQEQRVTVNTKKDLTLYFTAGQRSPNTTVKIFLPAGIKATLQNTTVNVIGRGNVSLAALAQQSIGRTGSLYSYSKVGEVAIQPLANGGSVIQFNHLDLRPANGADLTIVIHDVTLPKPGAYIFKAIYTTAKPEVLTSAGTGAETATLHAVQTITDLIRTDANSYTSVHLTWSPVAARSITLLQSLDSGKSYQPAQADIDIKNASANITNLQPNKLYRFRLQVNDGLHKGVSNSTRHYSGKLDIKLFGITGDSSQDYTQPINEAIEYVSQLGGGTLLFSKGIYGVRTIHLKSNVYLYIDKEATIKALKGGDAPEATWFSDKKYRSGLSPTDVGPYADPENYLTKQDVGHHYFNNSMFFAERADNIKIIGNGTITGNGNLATGDNVMNNAPGNRTDKMFTFKLCTNIEIGGIYRDADLWYDSTRDEPYYINKDGSIDYNTDNMLHIDRSGHFALLATGTDHINVHNTYFSKDHTSNVRDIYDFMACSHVTVTNIYSKVSSDDIVKPGSDCSLGFTRPAHDYKVRNIIGDTNCNLFQIGSETADDITDICVDNIYVLGSNKAGFSISTNDGGHVKNIHLNCAHTGALHSRSKMYRTFTPFFISISNRGRVLGAAVNKYAFTDNGEKHNELLVKNINIGEVENIIINGIDIYEVYAGSSFRGKRWTAYDGTQRRATPIVAGYSLPGEGLDFTLPNGKHTGYIKNIVFNDVQVLVKGGNPVTDTAATPPELGVGQYNASNLKVQPSYGLWARHVMDLTVKNCSFNYEKTDGRYALFLDDVIGAQITGVKMFRPVGYAEMIKLKKARGARIENIEYLGK